MLLADRASTAAAANGEEAVRLRAEVLAVFACNQLGRGASAGGRAVRALRAAQAVGAQVTERLVRVELAACATDASSPALALSLLQQVLANRRRVAPTARAAAMVAAADALAKLGGGPEVPELLVAADGLYDASRAVEPDAVLLRRGVVHGRLAAHHRRTGDFRCAERAARAGLALLDELSDSQLETGQVSGALTLELVLALLDSAREAEAVLAAQAVLRRSVRPAGAPGACWLRLALASRVHAPAGRYALARRLLGDAAFLAERNQLDSLLAECHQLQSQLHEQCAELPDALVSLRAAQFAERRWRSCTGELRTLLAAEFGTPPSAAQLRGELAGMVTGASALDQPSIDRFEPADRELPVLPRRAVGDVQFGSVPSGATERPTPIRRRPPSRPVIADGSDGPRLASAPELRDASPKDLVRDVTGGEASGDALPPVARLDGVDDSATSPAADRPAELPRGIAGVEQPVATDTTSPVGTEVVEPEPAELLIASSPVPTVDSPVPAVDSPEPAAGSLAAPPVVDAGAPSTAAHDQAQLDRVGDEAQVDQQLTAAPSQPSRPVQRTPTHSVAPAPPTEPPHTAPSTSEQVTPAKYAPAFNGAPPDPPVSPGRHRSDAALADLLAEALLAYQSGRRSQATAESAAEPPLPIQSQATTEPIPTQSATISPASPPPATPATASSGPASLAAPSPAASSSVMSSPAPSRPAASSQTTSTVAAGKQTASPWEAGSPTASPPAAVPATASSQPASSQTASPATASPVAASSPGESSMTASPEAAVPATASPATDSPPAAVQPSRKQPIRSAPVPRLAPPSMSPPRPRLAMTSQPSLDWNDQDGELPEPDPTVTQPTRVWLTEVPAPQTGADSAGTASVKRRSLIDVPADQVWREPGTF